jgi:uroporphyrinogen-III synthase
MPFDGLRVLSLESRRAAEMDILIRKQGGDPFVAPSVRERAIEEHHQAFEFAERLLTAEFDLVICTTGVGLTFLGEVVSPRIPLGRLTEALARITTIARGPKPAAVLRQWGVPVGRLIPEPNTWREVVAAVAELPERRIALLEYGRPNTDLVAALESLGGRVSSFSIYRWDLPENTAPLEEAARRIARRDCDVVLFTSSIQLEHLLQAAESLQIADGVLTALRNDLVVASIGPMMTEALDAHGIRPDIVPEHPKMGLLVKAAADESRNIRKRRAAGK